MWKQGKLKISIKGGIEICGGEHFNRRRLVKIDDKSDFEMEEYYWNWRCLGMCGAKWFFPEDELDVILRFNPGFGTQRPFAGQSDFLFNAAFILYNIDDVSKLHGCAPRDRKLWRIMYNECSSRQNITSSVRQYVNILIADISRFKTLLTSWVQLTMNTTVTEHHD